MKLINNLLRMALPPQVGQIWERIGSSNNYKIEIISVSEAIVEYTMVGYGREKYNVTIHNFPRFFREVE